MAQVDHWEDGGNAGMDLDFFYNVSFAVGPVGTAPNHRDDVMLVQYFLKNVAGTVVVGPGWEVWVPPKTAKPFQADGLMGPDTSSWIRSYQNSLKWLFKDGRVDRALSAWSSISKTLYTILSLNHHFQNAQPDKFAALEDDAEAPAELRAAISLSRARGSAGVPFEAKG